MRTLLAVGLALLLVTPAAALTKRQARKLCRRQIPDCVAALLAPTTTTTTTTVPVRARTASGLLYPPTASLGSVALTVEPSGILRVTFAPQLVGYAICTADWRLVQGPRQVGTGDDAGACAVDPPWCTTVAAGVVAETRLACPAVFDRTAPFTFFWGTGRTSGQLDVP